MVWIRIICGNFSLKLNILNVYNYSVIKGLEKKNTIFIQLINIYLCQCVLK